jgi:hypothetical protein
MSVRVSTWAWKLPLRGNGKLVLLALADQANDGGVCWPRQSTLAEKCGLGERALHKHLVELESGGYIVRERRHRRDGVRTSDLYTINLPAEFAGGTEAYPQNVRRLPAETRRGNPQKLRVLKEEPSKEPSEEPGPPRKSKSANRDLSRFRGAMR